MNGAVPNSKIAQAESKYLTMIDRNMLFEKSAGPLFGQAQDAILACALLTRSAVRISRRWAINILARAGVFPRLTKQVYTGREIVEFLIPPITFKRKANFYKKEYAAYTKYNEDETNVVIKRGKILSGVLDAASVKQGKKGGIYHIIALDHGFEVAFETIHKMQQASIEYMKSEGFTLHGGDYIFGDETYKLLDVAQEALLRKAEDLTARLNNATLVPPVGMTVAQYYEQSMLEILKAGDDPLIPILRTTDPQTNNFFRMADYGSRGSAYNFFNMTAFLGMPNIDNHMIPDSNSYKRSTHWDVRCPDEPAAHGYIRNSYVTGLDAREQYANAVKSRLDIITKGLMTSTAGYKNREGFKCCESIHTTNRNLVVIEKDMILQYMYGDHGINLKYMEMTSFPYVLMSNAQFELDYNPRELIRKFPSIKSTLTDTFKQLTRDRELFRKTYLRIEGMNTNVFISERVQLVVDPERIVENVFSTHDEPVKVSAGELERAIKRVSEFSTGICKWFYNAQVALDKLPSYVTTATTLFAMGIRLKLRPQILAKMNSQMLDEAFNTIIVRFVKAIIGYGISVGTLASQCISEPMTQFMLDSHHLAGSSKDEDIKNFEAIIRAFSAAKMGSKTKMYVFLKERLDEIKTQQVANTMEELRISNFSKSYAVIYEEFGKPRKPFADDKKFIDRWMKNHPFMQPGRLLNWCVRFQMDVFSIVQKNTTIEEIILGLKSKHPHIFAVWNTENENPFIRIYMTAQAFPRIQLVETEHVVKYVETSLLPTVIRGIDNIVEAKVRKANRSRIDANGAIVRDENRWFIQTKGTNLYGLAIRDDVDFLHTRCSNVHEVARVFGVEAARHAIVSELRNILSKQGIENTHYLMYADLMTMTGNMTKINVHGIKERERANILLRISVSHVSGTLVEGALGNVLNELTGISAPQLMGQIPKRGTTFNRYIINEEFVRKNTNLSVESVIDDL